MVDALTQSVFRKVKPKKIDVEEVPKEHRPMVHFDFETLPEAKDWEVGKTYKITLEVKQVGKFERGENEGNADFEVMKIKIS